MPDRAVLFIDGNNWYHALRQAELHDLALLDYAKISEKLLGPRDWVGTRYYIGRVRQVGNLHLYADQRRFLSMLQATDPRISTHLGRIEARTVENPCARELLAYLGRLPVRIDRGVYHDLMGIGRSYREAAVMIEKAVDVMLAVDMVMMAQRNEYDAAYLLSADGDFTPAVQAVRALGKKVYAASPAHGAQLAAVVNSFVHLTRDWFSECFRGGGTRSMS